MPEAACPEVSASDWLLRGCSKGCANRYFDEVQPLQTRKTKTSFSGPLTGDKGKDFNCYCPPPLPVMYGDQFLVLEDGRIAASGTHEQLLSSSQTYLDMWSAHISAMDWRMNQEVNQEC
jgi:hypothetical protein